MPKQFVISLLKYRLADWGNLGLYFFLAVSNTECRADVPDIATTNNPVFKQQLKPSTRDEWKKLLGWNEDCEQSFQSTQAGAYSGIETYPIGNADELVIVMCAVGGYQPSFLLFRQKGQTPRAIALVAYGTSNGKTLHRTQEVELWGEPVFLEKTSELVILNVARQTKDCGTWAKYGFKTDSVKLQELFFKLPCPKKVSEKDDLGSSSTPPKGWKRLRLFKN